LDSRRVHLAFSIGPVQEFVAQARRTRDLWAGSWLLSYLSETALAAAEKAGGTSVIPYREVDVIGVVSSVNMPVGGCPNRFELEFDDEGGAIKGAEAATNAFRVAWQAIADTVWEQIVIDIADKGNGTQKIWERQVSHFWEISWIVGTPEGTTLGFEAAARKHFRNVPATEEPGLKCSLMGNMQELSGHFGRGTGEQQSKFWEAVSKHKKVGMHDLRPNGERLCAIALIKRLFPKVITEAVPGADEALTTQSSWPSTAFFSAHSFLAELDQEVGEGYVEKVTKAGIGQGEREAAKVHGVPWATIDAQAWYRSGLQQNDWGIETVEGLRRPLSDLYKKSGLEPLPCYAMLIMDGDSMGSLLQKLGDPRELSRCLGRFAAEVGEIVSKRNGRTIYAGGDDVLALLPPREALQAARELAEKYTQAFGGNSAATLSGAIVFAHWRYPLRQVIREAHGLLDGVAKEATGRDALAIGILLGSGMNAIWSAPWKVINGNSAPKILDELIQKFSTEDTSAESTRFNASYLYTLRERFQKLFQDSAEMPGEYRRIEFGDDLLSDLAHAELRRRMSKSDRARTPVEDSKPTIDELMSLTRRWYRDEAHKVQCDARTFGFDGWRVARFLKQLDDNRMPGHE